MPPSSDDAPRVTVIIPARDEETNIGHCLEGLLAQDYPASRMRVIVVDDQSVDATAAIVRRFARQHPQITLINSPPLPPRWTGKS
ncbi:MAG: glycosyltransferase, partial [Xanthobacteraceae bacterium]